MELALSRKEIHSKIAIHGMQERLLWSFCAQVGKAYSGPREALRLTGRFVLAQLLHASFGPDAAAQLVASPFVTALQAEVRRQIWRSLSCLHGSPSCMPALRTGSWIQRVMICCCTAARQRAWHAGQSL
jgi:hypothetical protein